MLSADLDELLALSPVSREELTTKISAATPKRTPMVARLQKQVRDNQNSPLSIQTRRESLLIFDQMKKGEGVFDLGETSFLLPGATSDECSPLSIVQASRPSHSFQLSPLNTETSALSPITPAQASDCLAARRSMRSHTTKNSPFTASGGKHSFTPLSLPAPSSCSSFGVFVDTPDTKHPRSTSIHSPITDFVDDEKRKKNAATSSKTRPQRKAPLPLFSIAATTECDSITDLSIGLASLSISSASDDDQESVLLEQEDSTIGRTRQPLAQHPEPEQLPLQRGTTTSVVCAQAKGCAARPLEEVRQPLGELTAKGGAQPDVLRTIFAKARRLTMSANTMPL